MLISKVQTGEAGDILQLLRATYFISIALLSSCVKNEDSDKNLVFFL